MAASPDRGVIEEVRRRRVLKVVAAYLGLAFGGFEGVLLLAQVLPELGRRIGGATPDVDALDAHGRCGRCPHADLPSLTAIVSFSASRWRSSIGRAADL